MPVCQYFTFTSGEGHEETSPSFGMCYLEIEASNALLEVLTASLLQANGIAKEATSLMAINLLISVR